MRPKVFLEKVNKMANPELDQENKRENNNE